MNNSSNIGPFLKSYLDKKGADIEPLVQFNQKVFIMAKKRKVHPSNMVYALLLFLL